MTTVKDEASILAKLREPFPENQIGKLPKPTTKEGTKRECQVCGGWHQFPAIHLDYVGHAAITARLLDADPHWFYEPLSVGPNGLPVFDQFGGLWIRLTVGGMTRLGYGDAGGKSGANAVKEAIGDALRNAGMRFGMALDLWHKGDLYEADVDRGKAPEQAAQQNGQHAPAERDWLAEATALRGNVEGLRNLWREARALKASPQMIKQIEALAKPAPPKPRDFISEIDAADGNLDALRSLQEAAREAGDETAVHVIGDAIDSEMDRQGA